MSLFVNQPENNEGGILAKLWADIINANNLNNSLGFLTSRYLEKTKVQKTSGDSATKKTKSTITSDIKSNKMTFTTLVHLLYNLLNVKEVTFTVKIKFSNNEESVVSVPVPNPNKQEKINAIKNLSDDIRLNAEHRPE